MKQQWQRYKELELITNELLQSPNSLIPVLSQPADRANSRTLLEHSGCSEAKQAESKQPASQQSSTQRTWLQALWNVIDLALLRNLEPRIWHSDHAGYWLWHVYNPHTGETRILNTDAEIRGWLEQNFRY